MGRKKGEMKEIRKEMKNKKEENEFGREKVREEEKRKLLYWFTLTTPIPTT